MKICPSSAKGSNKNCSIIDTAIAFKNIIKQYPMMASSVIAIKNFKAATLTFGADMVNVINN